MKFIENLLMTEIHYSVMNIPGLEENVMIDSVSKDTVCVVQELAVLFQKTRS
jgi:hypothetical protein